MQQNGFNHNMLIDSLQMKLEVSNVQNENEKTTKLPIYAKFCQNLDIN